MSLALLQLAAVLGGGDSWLFDFIGLLNRDLGRSQEAILAFRRALALDPANDRARKRLAYLTAEDGELDEALEMLRILVARGEATAQLIHGVIRHLTSRGLPREEALDWYRLVLRTDPGNKWARLSEAHCLRAVGEVAQAQSIYQGLALEKEDQEIAVLASIGRATTLALQDKEEAAIAAADELVSRVTSENLPEGLRHDVVELQEWLANRATARATTRCNRAPAPLATSRRSGDSEPCDQRILHPDSLGTPVRK